MLKIGIDPAFRDSGFAICVLDTIEKTGRFIVFKNGFMDFLGWVFYDAPAKDENVIFIIENSNLQETFFVKELRYAESVGKNKAASQFTCDLLSQWYGKDKVFPISPKQKGAKIVDLKIFDAIVRQDGYKLSNYKGLANEQDKRDAYLCASKNIIKNFEFKK